jgi:glycosyltransferase involved in cell wall biosynthesis
LKLLVVTNMYPSERDPSFGTFVAEQVVGLRSRAVKVDVLFINGRGSKLNYVRAPFRLWKQMRGRGYDLIHAHYVFSGVVARLQRSLPVVVSFHGAGEMEGWQGWLCKRLAPFVDGATVTSKRHFRQLGFERARVVPCGVDTELFRPMPREEARSRLGLPSDAKLPLFAGTPRPEKRVPLIEEAVSLISKELEDVRLIKASGVAHDEVPIWMNAADVLVLASDWEGSPVVIKEAMACNLPIVTVDVGDAAEIVAGVRGCWVANQTAEDLAVKIQLALEFDGRTSGREKIMALSLDHTLDGVLDLYEEVLSGR